MKLCLSMQLEDISTYRSEMMGWAILWIMMLHFGFVTIMPLGFVAQYGYAGVEIFMFISGFGLFFSLERTNSIWEFYCRRLFRIFPVYYIIGLISSILIFHDSLFNYLYRYSTIGFWLNGIYGDWFIPSIFVLYLLAPFFKYIGIRGQTIIAVLFLLISYLLVEENDVIDGEHYFLLYRIPAFLYGMICGRWLQLKGNMNRYFLVLLVCLPIFVWLYPQFHDVYRYKYFSVLFMMPTFVWVFVIISKNASFLNPVVRRMGESSLEIYLTQGLFFVLFVRDYISRSDFTTFILIILCSISSYMLHKSLKHNRYYYLPAIMAYLFIAICLWYAIKWQPILTPEKQIPLYKTIRCDDDTLHVAMYGDSWVGLHPNKFLYKHIGDKPVLLKCCGEGGYTSGQIYNLMFSSREIIEEGVHYCIVIAGINDANANIGRKYYCSNYRLILRHLLDLGIRPVVIEIPDVDLTRVYGKKPIKDMLCDVYRAILTASPLYETEAYRKYLRNFLDETGLMDSVVYIGVDSWNPIGYRDSSLYLDDGIHLNALGYKKLDSCVLRKIEEDFKNQSNNR